jgi:hypothetical protein
MSSWVLALAEGLAVSEGDKGELLFSDARGRLGACRFGPALADALHRLAPPGESAGRLAESVLEPAGAGCSRASVHAIGPRAPDR